MIEQSIPTGLDAALEEDRLDGSQVTRVLVGRPLAGRRASLPKTLRHLAHHRDDHPRGSVQCRDDLTSSQLVHVRLPLPPLSRCQHTQIPRWRHDPARKTVG